MRNIVLGVVSALALGNSAASAHHGYAGFFDPMITVAIEGT
jgi:hypothetical protein